MNPTADQLRAQGWVEASPGVWTKANLGAGSGVESRHAAAEGQRGETITDLKRPGWSSNQNRTTKESASGSSAPPARTVKRLRQSSMPLLNKLETEWFALPEACGFLAQAVRFRLGNGIWYKPDGFNPKTLIAVEVKGPHAFRGGFENLKVAASLYPMIRWRLVWKTDGHWQEQEVLP